MSISNATIDIELPIQTSAAPKSPIKQSHYGPKTFLAQNEIRELCRINARRMFGALAFDFAVIGVASAAAEALRHPLAYLIAVMIIGARFAGIGSIALHDGAHQLLLRNRLWNDRLGSLLTWIVFTPLLISFSSYRKSHFGHHRHTNTDDDPDLILTESFYRGSRLKTLASFLIALSGVAFVFAVIRFLLQNRRANLIGLITLSSLICTIATGLYFDVYAAHLACWYWIAPVATWGILVNQVRAFAEHYPVSAYSRSAGIPEVFRTREVLNSWFDSLFVVTRGLNYHLSHHLCPQVPFYNLPELQAKLATSPIYREYAHVTHGYHRVFCEFLCRPSF